MQVEACEYDEVREFTANVARLGWMMLFMAMGTRRKVCGGGKRKFILVHVVPDLAA